MNVEDTLIQAEDLVRKIKEAEGEDEAVRVVLVAVLMTGAVETLNSLSRCTGSVSEDNKEKFLELVGIIKQFLDSNGHANHAKEFTALCRIKAGYPEAVI